MDIVSIYRKFKTQEDCIRHLEQVRWPQGPVCVYCKSKKVSFAPKELRHHCNTCNKTFSVTVGTIFHHTHLPLQVWFVAISLILNAKKGLSARQLGRDLLINKNSAWRISMKIREAMKYDEGLLTGIVEVDETFIGGKPRKKNEIKKGTKVKPKSPVLGAVSRDGKVVTKILNKRATLSSKTLNDFIQDTVQLDTSIVVTDKYRGYDKVHKFTRHGTINHSKRFSEFDGRHINTIEGFWALVKRGITGQYHKVSEHYLANYLDEFSYRYNNRKLKKATIFDKTIKRGLSV